MRLLISLAPLVLIAAPANATVYTITATGSPEFAVDHSGLFGNHLKNYENFSMSVTFDDAAMQVFEDSATSRLLIGSPISAIVTVAGISHGAGIAWGGTIEKESYGANGTGLHVLLQNETVIKDALGNDIYRYQSNFSTYFVDRDTPGSTAFDDPSYTDGFMWPDAGATFTFYETDLTTTTSKVAAVGSAWSDTLSFTITKQGAAVPEPGTWMMMLLGFGAAGVAVRRRRAMPLRAA